MNIGIIGLGVVGSVLLKAFKKLGNKCFGLDISNIHEKKKLLFQDIIYICVPTNFYKNSLDVKIIKYYLNFLNKNKFYNTIAIKSTLNPGDIKKFKKQYRNLKKNICYVPEFLRERFAYKDFTINHDLLVIGGSNKHSIKKIISNHGKFPRKTVVLKPEEAELIKIFSNSYNAARVVFANCFYEVCLNLKVDYNKILKTYLLRKLSTGNYLNCSKTLRGFGGKCLPKDLRALSYCSKKLSKKISFFDNILNQNKKFPTTI